MTHPLRRRLRCNVVQVEDIFLECLAEAEGVMSARGVEAWLDGASLVCGLGRGTELVLIFLQEMPEVAKLTHEDVIGEVAACAEHLSKNACGPAINPFLSSLPLVARRLNDLSQLRHWLGLVRRMADEAPRGMDALLGQVPLLFVQLSIGGINNWVDYGIKSYREQPHRLADFFGLVTPDSQAVFQRERHGTLYIDEERQLKLWLRSLWGLEEVDLRPYSLTLCHPLKKPRPHLDKLGFHIPDVFDDEDGVAGIDRYRAMLAHMAAHKLWSRPYFADNYSTFQHIVVECFEDSRVEYLAMARYPGLRRLWLALHPAPAEDACPEGWSCLRHKLAMLSRAILDPDHDYRDKVVLEYVRLFREKMASDPYDPETSIELGVRWFKENHAKDFRRPKIWFQDTEVGYRDDNRYLWVFLEDTDNEDEFHSDHGHAPPPAEGSNLLPPRHYPEWDWQARQYRPDWATVYEAIQPMGDAGLIDSLLERHALLAKRLKRVVDLLKPHQRRRIRYQNEGDEVDLDVLIRAMTDFRSGAEPDPRIHVRYEKSGRNIALLLLLDLSQSIRETPKGASHSILQLSQEAVSLLGWTVDQLGDAFAVAGFASNTRHEVRYTHFKGFREPWGEEAKGRLAAMEAGLSTRMGAAIRHAGRYLESRREEKKLLLILTDGEPSDIDVSDPRYLKDDTHAAVGELRGRGIDSFCISLDEKADEYVAEIFGPARFAVIDRVEMLPEKLSKLFIGLTR